MHMAPVKEQILQKLLDIEKRENVTILFAAESGSRAWGFSSPDSDYDVRFLYLRREEDYLRLDKIRDVIELPVDPVWDINGWDIQKALRLLYKSNPTLFEWLNSPIIYQKSKLFDGYSSLAGEYFSPCQAIHHYLGMIASDVKQMHNRESIRLKKYCYLLRSLLACSYILEYLSPPPVLFSELAESQLDKNIADIVNLLLQKKTQDHEKSEISHNRELDAFILKKYTEIEEALSKLPPPKQTGIDRANRFFVSLIRKNESEKGRKA